MVNIPVTDTDPIITVNVWRYISLDGYEIIAGKSDKDNDILSLKLADPNDWWFHVRGVPGSHVLLRVNKSISYGVNKKILNQAAAVAAYHSKSRQKKITFVSGTLAKYVTKPRYSKPGTVVIRNERVFRVKPSISL